MLWLTASSSLSFLPLLLRYTQNCATISWRREGAQSRLLTQTRPAARHHSTDLATSTTGSRRIHVGRISQSFTCTWCHLLYAMCGTHQRQKLNTDIKTTTTTPPPLPLPSHTQTNKHFFLLTLAQNHVGWIQHVHVLGLQYVIHLLPSQGQGGVLSP